MPEPNTPIGLFTPDEIAAECRVHPRTVYRAVQAGHIRSVRIGRQIRIPATERERILNEGFEPKPVKQSAA